LYRSTEQTNSKPTTILTREIVRNGDNLDMYPFIQLEQYENGMLNLILKSEYYNTYLDDHQFGDEEVTIERRPKVIKK
jgi:hypothetical protein